MLPKFTNPKNLVWNEKFITCKRFQRIKKWEKWRKIINPQLTQKPSLIFPSAQETKTNPPSSVHLCHLKTDYFACLLVRFVRFVSLPSWLIRFVRRLLFCSVSFQFDSLSTTTTHRLSFFFFVAFAALYMYSFFSLNLLQFKSF